MPDIDENANGRTIELPLQETLTLRLSENPTTGFRWRVVSDGAPACRLAEERYEAPTGPIGAGGEHFWQVVPVGPGTGRIELAYGRPWERKAVRSFTLSILVR